MRRLPVNRGVWGKRRQVPGRSARRRWSLLPLLPPFGSRKPPLPPTHPVLTGPDPRPSGERLPARAAGARGSGPLTRSWRTRFRFTRVARLAEGRRSPGRVGGHPNPATRVLKLQSRQRESREKRRSPARRSPPPPGPTLLQSPALPPPLPVARAADTGGETAFGAALPPRLVLTRASSAGNGEQRWESGRRPRSGEGQSPEAFSENGEERV